MLWNKFRAWLLDCVTSRLDRLSEAGDDRFAAISTINASRHAELLDELTALREMSNSTLNAMDLLESRLGRAEYPMTPEMLMAWDAITFAVEKFTRDPQDDAVRLSEVLRWAKIYLSENKWAIPTDDVLVWLLGRRDLVNDKCTVGRFN